jgi:hypothetical protein
MTIKRHDNMLLKKLKKSIQLVEYVELALNGWQPGKPSGIKILEGRHFYLIMKTYCLC